jgi:hypothetical protein
VTTTSILSAVAIAAISIQFIPVERTNPLDSGGPNFSLELQWVLQRSCCDCHSNETRWPIWAYAPLHPDSRLGQSDLESVSARTASAPSEADTPALPPARADSR